MGFRQTIHIIRQGGGAVDDAGIYQPGEVEELEINASVQPLNLQEHTFFAAEGGRNASYIKMYSDTPLRPVKEAYGECDEQTADIVQWQGRQFEVIQCDTWQNRVINHYKIIAKEIMRSDE